MRIRTANSMVPEFRVIKEYWQMLSIIGTIIFFGVYLFIENREYRHQVDSLSEANKEMRDRISRLEGQTEVTHSMLNAIFENDPSILDYRLEKLEQEFNKRKSSPKSQPNQTVYHIPYFYPQLKTPIYEYKRSQPDIAPSEMAGSIGKKKGFLNLFKKQDTKK